MERELVQERIDAAWDGNALQSGKMSHIKANTGIKAKIDRESRVENLRLAAELHGFHDDAEPVDTGSIFQTADDLREFVVETNDDDANNDEKRDYGSIRVIDAMGVAVDLQIETLTEINRYYRLGCFFSKALDQR